MVYRYIVIIKSYIHVNPIFLPLLPPKHAKTREPKDEHCVSWCTPVHVHVPLDNFKTHLHLTLP